MSEIPIGADVVEAAAAYHESARRAYMRVAGYGTIERWEEMPASSRAVEIEHMQAALDKLGLREERAVRAGLFGRERYVLEPGESPYRADRKQESRLVSDWGPVDAEPAPAASIHGYANGGNLASVRVDPEPRVPGDGRHLMEIVFGPCTREEAGDRAIEVQRLLDERFPEMSAAVGVRYGIGDRVDTEPSEPLSVLRDLVEAYDAWNVNNYPSDGGSRNAAQAWFAEAQAVENVVERARALVEAWPSATSEGER
jgi:hypothetical protein